MAKIVNILRMLRIEQWLKNCFVLVPIFFGGKLFDGFSWKEGLLTFVAFSLMASAVYCFNDIRDVASDRLHPHKCMRPIASGAIGIRTAIVVALLLAVTSFALVYFTITPESATTVSAILLLYLLLNVAYSLWLKNISIVDAFIVALGFVLRLFAGGVAESIHLSPWIVLMTFLLALFLVFAKRRDDIVLSENKSIEMRKSVRNYSLGYINAVLIVLASITMVCYIMYTLSPDVMRMLHCDYMYISSVFVLAGILRYLHITLLDQQSGDPTQMLIKDAFIQGCIVLWLVFFILILY